MLTLKPAGRGNWTPTRITIDGQRIGAMSFRVGQQFELGGIVWRVVRVEP